MKNILAFLACAVLTLSGCETTVEVDTPPHTPRLSLNYTLSNQPPTVAYRQAFGWRDMFVSASQSVLEVQELKGRPDATVQLLDEAGQVVEQFRSVPRPGYFYNPNDPDSLRGYYAPVRGFVGEPGRTYTLRAAAPGLDAVEATLTLPTPALIETGSFSVRPTDPNAPSYAGYQPGRLTFSLLDEATTVDYYLAYARVLTREGRPWGTVQRDYNVDTGVDGPVEVTLNRFQLSEGGNNYGQGQFPFGDAGGNGQRLALSADVVLQYSGGFDPTNPNRMIPVPGYVEIIVSSITPDTYRFYQSVQRYYDTDGNPFAEPAPLYSNLRPGYGLFGGATDVTYRIPL
jgi:hypothetical protein